MTQKKAVPFAEMSMVEKKKYLAENYERMRAEDAKIVRGKFIYHECPGGMMEFSFRKYKGDPIEKYQLVDNAIYSLPLGVAKHLNSNCGYPEYAFAQGEDNLIQANGFANGHVLKITKKTRRCSFQSLEFIEEDFGGDGGLLTVERVA